MGKKPAERVLSDTEAKAYLSSLRTSPQKLNLVAASIRGLKAEVALRALTFSKRRIAQDVKKALMSAIANAENNHQLDVDRLYVAEAYVGKQMVLKRFSARARGRVGRVEKPFSNLTVIVRERAEATGE
jgi:large subunit ribosomal protein L22